MPKARDSGKGPVQCIKAAMQTIHIAK